MRRAVVTLVPALVLLGATGCGEDDGGAPAGAAPPTSVTASAAESSSASEARETVLDGIWEAQITEKAFLAYLAEQGVRPPAARAAVERDLPGPDFSVELLDGYFNVTGPTGESWHSGTYEVHGDELHLIEPGGFPPFRLAYELDGDRVQLEVAEGQAGGPEHLPGVPGIVAGGALWCSVPWERVSG